MAGPFEGYSPPGNYSRTNVEEPQPVVAASARVPIFIGTGSETLQRKSFEVIRGSSATVDTAVYSENVSSRFLTKSTTKFSASQLNLKNLSHRARPSRRK